ncbi:hypothetical protein WOLCODRAFT_61304 [Wolfiporia cocos MD-104 SS10]|uniref:Uncharacterized protein n=1 Tax=Wolfiporia cocos (strain MD-104) TaxID=742152 RepID=A0A2H3IX15_WOLCO|nr:hypothetical protein WOLCODRAFT_61304 [Wolfiporia cocos MD-104 SS10]
MTTADSAWLQDKLQALLNSPYIHFNAPAGIRIGHGPIDLFSTRFNNLFTKDAAGTVNGSQLDREGLKQQLLQLQKKWNDASASFSPVQCAQDDVVGTRFDWTRSDSSEPAEVTAEAAVQEQGGAQRINALTLTGDASLFSLPTSD